MEEKKSASGLAVTAMILGIVSLVFALLVWVLGGIGLSTVSKVCIGVAFALGIIGALLGAVSTVLAIMAKKAEDTSTISTVALLLSVAGLVLCGLNFVSCLSCVACSAFTRSSSVTSSILNSIF